MRPSRSSRLLLLLWCFLPVLTSAQARLIALQDAAAVARPAEAAAAEGGEDVQLSEAQEKILVKVLKESKAKIKGKSPTAPLLAALTHSPLQ